MTVEERKEKDVLLTFRPRRRYSLPPSPSLCRGSMYSVLWVRRCLRGSTGTSGPVQVPGDPPWFGRFGSTGHANRRHSIILAPNSLIEIWTKERQRDRTGDTLLAVLLGAVKKINQREKILVFSLFFFYKKKKRKGKYQFPSTGAK